jgi:glycosyltransferase involved in cell wall biosynthesis
MDKDSILGKIKAARQGMTGKLPNVYLIHGDLTDTEMNSLYNHPKVTCHINLTHGEGYGRPLQEASLSGKPIIASAWSGHIDFLDRDACTLVGGKLTQVPKSAVNKWIIGESKWFTASYTEAAACMLKVMEDPSQFDSMAKTLADRNEKKKSFPAMDEVFKKILTTYVPKFATTQEVVLPKLNLPKLKKVQQPAKV